jgi:hypothetical protein
MSTHKSIVTAHKDYLIAQKANLYLCDLPEGPSEGL